jgi:hypothetical protein
VVVADDAIESVMVADVMINQEENDVLVEVIVQNLKVIDVVDAQIVLNQDAQNLLRIDHDAQDVAKTSWLGI